MKSNDILRSADEKFDAQEFDSALAIYEDAARVADTEENKQVLVEAYSQIARCYLKKKEMAQAGAWLAKAGQEASKDEPKGWSRYLGVKGRLEWHEAIESSGEMSPVAEKAAVTFKEMYLYCLDYDLYERAIDAANMMTIVGDTDERIAWGLKGIEAAEKGGYVGQLAMLWNNHGWNLHDLARYEESLDALKMAREYHYRGERELPKLIADWSVGYAYRKIGHLDSAGQTMSKVYEWADSLYRNEPSTGHAEWLGFAARELGEIALIEGKNAEALAHFENAKTHLAKAGMPEWDKRGFEELETKIENLRSR